MQDVNVKGNTALELVTKIWELVPDDTKNELIESESDIIKGITVLEKALGNEETIIKITTAEEAEEIEPQEDGEDNVD